MFVQTVISIIICYDVITTYIIKGMKEWGNGYVSEWIMNTGMREEGIMKESLKELMNDWKNEWNKWMNNEWINQGMNKWIGE